jgi:hypothetical protein
MGGADSRSSSRFQSSRFRCRLSMNSCGTEEVPARERHVRSRNAKNTQGVSHRDSRRGACRADRAQRSADGNALREHASTHLALWEDVNDGLVDGLHNEVQESLL